MTDILRALRSQKRIAGGALVLAVTGFGASVCGLLRDQAFSIMYPLSHDSIGVASVYIAAFRPSDLLFQVTVMSSLSVVLVPFLAGHLAQKRTEDMNAVTNSTIVLFGIIFGCLAISLGIAFRHVAPLFVSFKGESLELYIQFGRMALLTNALFLIGNTLGQYLITVQRYWIYGITPILWSLSTIVGIYLFTPFLGPMGVMQGTLCGTIILVLFRVHGAWKAGFRFTIAKNGFLHSDSTAMGWLIIPRMIALGALQLQLLIFDRLGSGLGTQMVAINQFASNFESVIPGIAGIAIGQSLFSLLSQSHAKKAHEDFWQYIRKGIWMNSMLTIPSALALGLLPNIPAWLLHIQSPAALLFETSLMIYAFAVPFESTNHILLRAFYAQKNTKIPAITTAISSACGIGSCYTLLPFFGLYALAIGYVLTQCIQCFLLAMMLYARKNKLRNNASAQLLISGTE